MTRNRKSGLKNGRQVKSRQFKAFAATVLALTLLLGVMPMATLAEEQHDPVPPAEVVAAPEDMEDTAETEPPAAEPGGEEEAGDSEEPAAGMDEPAAGAPDGADIPAEEPAEESTEEPAEDTAEEAAPELAELSLEKTMEDGTVVMVEGLLPMGTVLHAELIQDAEVEDALGAMAAESGCNLAGYIACNITLRDAEDNEIQPEASVLVTIQNPEFNAAADIGVACVDDDMSAAEVVAEGGNTAEVAHFSIYAVYKVSALSEELVEILDMADLQAKINAAEAGVNTTFVLGADISLNNSLLIPAGKVITLAGSHRLIGTHHCDTLTVNGALTLDGVTVTHNTGDFGRGVYLGAGASLTISGSSAISGNTLVWYYSGPLDGAGVYMAEGASLIMNGGSITGNKTPGNYREITEGGGVYAAAGATIDMSSGVISGNEASYCGGGVSFHGAVFNMYGNAEISGNKALGYLYNGNQLEGKGGGVNIESGEFNMYGSAVILGNYAEWRGGGVSNWGTFNMHGSASICENYTHVIGGGVWNMAGTFNMYGSASISQNNAYVGSGVANGFGDTTSGGAFNMSENASISHNIGRTEGHAQSWGGGVANLGSAVFTMSGGTISNNAVTQDGGGVMNASNAPGGSFILAGGCITNNAAASKGGGVINYGFMAYNAPVSVNTGHISFVMTGGTVSANTAEEGGGIYSSSDADGAPEDVSSVAISGGKVFENTAKKGGGICNYNGSVDITGGAEVCLNSAANNGGGIYNSMGLLNIAQDAKVYGNGAGWYGGGMLTMGGHADVSGSAKIYGNTTGYDGGGIWVRNHDDLTVSESVAFYGNKAKALYLLDEADPLFEMYKAHVFVPDYAWTVAGVQYGYNNYDINYTGGVETQVYTVTYLPNGADGDMPDSPVNVAGGTAYTVSETVPAREGYTFSGWLREDDSIVYQGGERFTMPNCDVTLTAQWTAIPDEPKLPDDPQLPGGPKDPDDPVAPITYYTVRYLPGTRGTFAEQSTPGLRGGDATPAAPNTTGQSGWKFTGWSPVVSVTVEGDATYTAQWRKVPPTTPPATPETPPATPPEIPPAPPAPPPAGPVVVPPAAPVIPTPPNTPPTDEPPAEPVEDTPAAQVPEEPVPAVPAPHEVTENSVPSGVPSITIGDMEIPLAGWYLYSRAWALVNLILAVLGAVLGILTILRVLRRKKRENAGEEDLYKNAEDEEDYRQRRMVWFILAIAMAVAGVVLFILTEDMRLPMVLVDEWTIVNLIIFIAELTGMLFAFKRRNSEEDEETQDGTYTAA